MIFCHYTIFLIERYYMKISFTLALKKPQKQVSQIQNLIRLGPYELLLSLSLSYLDVSRQKAFLVVCREWRCQE